MQAKYTFQGKQVSFICHLHMMHNPEFQVEPITIEDCTLDYKFYY